MKTFSVSQMTKNRNFQIDFDKKESIMTRSTLKTPSSSLRKNISFTSNRNNSANKD
jgi:hypothetical protein